MRKSPVDHGNALRIISSVIEALFAENYKGQSYFEVFNGSSEQFVFDYLPSSRGGLRKYFSVWRIEFYSGRTLRWAFIVPSTILGKSFGETRSLRKNMYLIEGSEDHLDADAIKFRLYGYEEQQNV